MRMSLEETFYKLFLNRVLNIIYFSTYYHMFICLHFHIYLTICLFYWQSNLFLFLVCFYFQKISVLLMWWPFIFMPPICLLLYHRKCSFPMG